MAVDREFLAERDAKIVQMKLQGLSVPEIAKRFSVSPTVVKSALDRQYDKFVRYNGFSLAAEIVQELERLDIHYRAIFPLTQMRNVTMPDGTQVTVEPNEKFVAQALAIHDRRVKLLGLDRGRGMAAPEEAPMRVTLAGSERIEEGPRGNPEVTGRQMLELMAESGIISDDVVSIALGKEQPALEEAVEIV